jgi:hypothetical protein
MASQVSPRIAAIVSVCALLTGVVAPLHTASSQDRRGQDTRTIELESRINAEAMRQRRELDAARQSIESESRARATEDRGRDMQRRIDDISRSTRDRR